MALATCRLPALALILFTALGACGADALPTPRGPLDGDGDVVDAPVAPDLAVLGGECAVDGECGSGICAGGVCCATRCEGSCQRCDQVGTRGTCTRVPGGTACGGNLCLDGNFVPQATCDQQGSCSLQAPVSCAPFLCLDNRCVSVCTRDDECQPSFVCRQGTCTKPGGGTACTAGGECASGICTQGVCCNRVCTSPCESCALPGFRGVCQQVPPADRPDAGCVGDAGADADGSSD